MRIWDKFLTADDKAVAEASGWGSPGGLGTRPAVLIIDVNNAFCGDKDEPIADSIKKWRSSCGPVAWRAIPHIQALIDGARDRRVPIFYTTSMDQRPDGFTRGAWRNKNLRYKEDRVSVVPGMTGNDIVAQIAPEPQDVVIRKPKPSAFFGTALATYLIDLGVDTLLVCGTVTSGCVRSTVLDAAAYNYRVGLVEDCTFDRFEVSHAINLFDMNAKYADVIGIGETLDYLKTVERGLYDAKIAFPVAAGLK
jgi:nicotinamidase-related amidase